MLVDNINYITDREPRDDFFVNQMEQVIKAAMAWKEIDDDTASHNSEVEMAYDNLRKAIENYELMLENKEKV